VNLADLQAVVDANADEQQGIYGVFDHARVPHLSIPSFESVKNISAAVSPDCSYRLVRDAVNAAEHTLDLYIYNVSAEHLLDLLRDAKERGVDIRIMYDAMDTRGGEKDKLRALGVALKEAPSTGRRQVFTVCHQKFAVIDNRILLLGSANWASTSIPKVTVPGKFQKGNREWLVCIGNDAVAGWFARLFQADWDIVALAGPQGAMVLPQLPVVESLEMRMAAVTIPDEVFDIASPVLSAGVRVIPILSPDNYFTLVRNLIRNAQTSIDLEQQYIVAGGPKTQGLLEDLSSRKGEVEIRILVSPAFDKNWKKSVETLTAAGLLDCLRAINLNSFTHLHNKGVLVDRKFTVITSTNMSENSITQAREAGVLIESEEIGSYYTRVLDVDWASGIDPEHVLQHLATIGDALVRVEEPTLNVHPADLRMI
jgi:phosphatidylserine/phosphatidylglycerophosphate/cardiolipin synthase-like enzyme